jgi:hypothetical protein
MLATTSEWQADQFRTKKIAWFVIVNQAIFFVLNWMCGKRERPSPLVSFHTSPPTSRTILSLSFTQGAAAPGNTLLPLSRSNRKAENRRFWQLGLSSGTANIDPESQSRLESCILLLQALGKGFQIRNATGGNLW